MVKPPVRSVDLEAGVSIEVYIVLRRSPTEFELLQVCGGGESERGDVGIH